MSGAETDLEKRKPGRPRKSLVSDDEIIRIEKRKPRRSSESVIPERRRKSSLTDADISLRDKLRKIGRPAPVVQDLAVFAERRPRRTQPKNRHETVVLLPQSDGKRLRIGPLCHWRGERLIKAPDGSILGVAGYVDSQTPVLEVPRIYEAPQGVVRKERKKSPEVVEMLEDQVIPPIGLSEEGWSTIGGVKFLSPTELRAWSSPGAADAVFVPFRQSISAEQFMMAEIKLSPGGLKQPERVNRHCGIDITVLDCAEGDPIEVCVNDGKKRRLGKFGCLVACANQIYSIFNHSKKTEATLKLVVIRKEPIVEILNT